MNGVKIYLFVIIYLLITVFVSNAKECCIIANVVDATDGTPLPYCGYTITKKGDSTPLINSVSSQEGEIREILKNEGEYCINLKYIGKEDYKDCFSVKYDDNEISLGIIGLKDDNKMLDEVVVTAKKSLIKSDGSKLTYSAEDDPAAKSGSVIELLRKVPMVTVDGENNIRLNGNTSFKIYLNGKEDPMLSNNASDVLKSMPASSIKKIEVISEPGAKYDAEGVGGILNIVTEDKRIIDGYMANISADVGNAQGVGIVYARAKYGKLTSSINFISGVVFPRTSIASENREDFITIDNHLFTSTNVDIRQDALFNIGGLQLSYEADSLNLFTLSSNLQSIAGGGVMNEKHSVLTSENTLINRYRSHSDVDISNLYFNVALNYQHTFKRQGHDLIVSYRYDYGRNKRYFVQIFDSLENYTTIINDRINSLVTPNHEHTFQIDYTNPFNGKHMFETGAKYIIRRNVSDAKNYFLIDDQQILNEANTVNMQQYQDVAAVYGSYTLSLTKIVAKAGLRYEHTKMGVDFKYGDYENYMSHLNDVVPNASVTYKFNDLANLSLSYQMKIRRPNVSNLNPYRDTSMPTEVSYGNPDLTSERNNNITLTYSDFGNKIGFNVWLRYNLTDNMIGNYTYVDKGVKYSTYENLGKYSLTQLNFYGTWQISSAVRFGLNSSVSYSDYKYPNMNIKNNGWQGNFGCDLNCTLPWQVRMSAYGGYSSPWIAIQGKNSSWYYYGISFSKSFLKENRLEVTIKAYDFFTKYKNYKSVNYADTYYSESISKSPQWGIGISVSYRFGSLSQDVKKTSKSIDNNDLIESKSNNIGGNK